MANVFKSYTRSNIGVTTVGIYTCPSSTTSVVIGFILSNTTASEVLSNVILNKSSVTANDVFIVKNISIPTGTFYDFNAGNKIILETGDKIEISSNMASSVDVIVSVLEQT